MSATNPQAAPAYLSRWNRDAFRFFLTNAGGIVGQSALTAAALMRAERAARDREWDDMGTPELGQLRYRWIEDDSDPAGSFDDPRDEAHVRADGWRACILDRAVPGGWEVLASLWGISESLNTRERDAYRRLVEAELALEAGVAS